MTRKGHRERFLAERLAEIVKEVAGDSPTGLARLLHGVAVNDTTSRTDEVGRHIESDRRLIQRWLAADALMERKSRRKILATANEVLVARGDYPFPDDFLEVSEPDHLDEINQKLGKILELLMKQEKRAPRWEKALKQQLDKGAAEQSDPASPRRRADAR